MLGEEGTPTAVASAVLDPLEECEIPMVSTEEESFKNFNLLPRQLLRTEFLNDAAPLEAGGDRIVSRLAHREI